MDEIPLHTENGEGRPCWARIEDAVAWLDNPILTPFLKGDPVAVGNFERARRSCAPPGPERRSSDTC